MSTQKISDLLKQTRKEKNLTLDSIAKVTKIKSEYLQAIEEGKFDDLPSESYARGFVKNYGSFLGLMENKVAALFRREYESERIEFVPRFRKQQHKFNRKSLFSPRNILIICAIIIIASFVGYQYSSLFVGPDLQIERPKNGEMISGSVVEVEGKTDPYAIVEIEREQVYVGLDGKFKKSIYVFSGNKKIQVVAKNRFGKATIEEINVKVR